MMGKNALLRVGARLAALGFALTGAAPAVAQITQTVDIPTSRAQDARIVAESNGANAAVTKNDNSASALRIGDEEAAPANDRGYRSILSFGTFAIPSNATLTTATLKTTRGTSQGTVGAAFGSPIIEIKRGAYFSPPPKAEDFTAASDLSPIGTLAIGILPGTHSFSMLSPATLNFINKAGGPSNGITQMKIRYTNLTDNDAASDWIGFYSGRATTAANRPFLRVTYTVPSSNVVVTPGGITFLDQDVDAGATAPADVLTIQNLGGTALTISSVTLIGTNASEFSVTSDTGQTTLLTNQTRTLNLVFNPTLPIGNKTAILRIVSSDTLSPTLDIPLNGLALDQEVAAAPPSLDFGSLLAGSGQTVAQAVAISNSGNADLTITGVSITGTDAAAFAITSDTGEGTLTSPTLRTVNVAFTPSLPAGPKSANLRIVSNDNDEATTNVLLTANVFTLTPTPSLTPSISPSPTPTLTASISPSLTASLTPTPTPTLTPSLTDSPTPTPTPSPSESLTPSPTETPSPTLTPTASVTASPTASLTASLTDSPTPTPTASQTASISPTATLSPTPNAATDWDAYE